jgi:hypothetical protein
MWFGAYPGGDCCGVFVDESELPTVDVALSYALELTSMITS